MSNSTARSAIQKQIPIENITKDFCVWRKGAGLERSLVTFSLRK